MTTQSPLPSLPARRFALALRSPLTYLLVAYLLVAGLYSVVTPIFEASDELWHYPMVKYMADHRLALPIQDPAVDTAWRQEGSQPPLYYMLGAVLTSWIDTSDLDTVRKLNPHPDIGVLPPDGNINMIVHDPSVEGFPWHGTVLALHLVRFLSILLGAVTVVMTYVLTHDLFLDHPRLALVAAAFTAFNPMFLFISGSVNNDNLSNALASLLLVLIVRLLKRVDAPRLRDLVLIGVVAGAGMLAKFNVGFLLPLIALALAINAYRVKRWRVFWVGAAVTGVLTVALSGWWYIRNLQLYGDPTGLNMFVRIVGPRPIPANLPQLWSERQTFLMSYWGFFGGVNVPMPDFVYAVFNVLMVTAIAGLLIGLVKFMISSPATSMPAASSERIGHFRALRRAKTDNSVISTVSPSAVEARSEVGFARHCNWPILLGRAFTVVWIVVLFVSLLRWTSVTWASQGRLMFSAIAPISMWMAVGLWQLGQLIPFIRWRAVLYSSVWSGTAAMVGLIVIAHAYGDPYVFQFVDRNPSHDYSVLFSEPGRRDPSIRVYGGGLLPSLLTVGDYLQFCTYFALEPGFSDGTFSRDWSVYVHVVNADGLIIAQRDVLPGQGQWATSKLNLGFAPLSPIAHNDPPEEWCNRFAVRIPDYTYVPAGLTEQVQVKLGLYDLKTGQRMLRYYSGDKFDLEPEIIGDFQIVSRPSPYGVPNGMKVNFGGEAELIGYDVSTLIMRQGQEVTVTLYWRALHQMTTDYRVFVQVLEPNTVNVFGQNDGMPAEWKRPTSTWKLGEIIEDKHTFKINANAPLGTWQIGVGMYQPTPDNPFKRLRIITPDGGEAEDLLYLSRVRIDPAP